MSTVFITLDQLKESTGALVATEKGNKKILEFFDASEYTANLHQWAALSFQHAYPICAYKLTSPLRKGDQYLCSDGIYRTIWDYIPFCLGYEFTTYMNTLQTKFEGFSLSYSVQIDPSILITIHATKT